MKVLSAFLRKSVRKRTLLRFVNVAIIGAILLSVLPPISASAASNAASIAAVATPRETGKCNAPNRDPVDPDGAKIFLPLVVGGATTQASVVADGDAPPAATARMLDYQVGKTYAYLYDYAIVTESKGRDAEGSNTSDKQYSRINAYVDVTVLEKAADGTVEAQLIMRDAFVCSSSGENEETVEDDAEFLAVLATPMRFKQAPNGTISDIRTVSEVPPFVVNTLKGALNFMQLELREGSDSYDTEERGGQGVYNVTYKLEDKEDGLHISKRVITDDYKDLQSTGDNSESLELDTALQIVVGNDDGVISSVSLNEDHLSADGEEDAASTGDEGIDGVSIWSTAEASGSLKLESVKDEDVNAASLPLAVYVQDDIVGYLDDSFGDQSGIVFEDYDLDAELDKLEADPTAPEPFELILLLYEADPGSAVIDAIGARLAANAAVEAVANTYIDLLSLIGTEQAQQLINGVLGTSLVSAANIAASVSMTTEAQALLAMVVLEDPSETTVDTLVSLSTDENFELQDMAISVLGAAAYNLSDTDAQKSEEIAASLTSRLQSASNEEEITLLLDAVGNTGSEASFDAVRGFIEDPEVLASALMTDTDTTLIRAAAFDALRKMENEAVEGLMLAPLSGDSGESELVRMITANALLDRDANPATQLSPAALSSVAAYFTTVEGSEDVGAAGVDEAKAYRYRTWGKSFGNSYVGVKLPGGVYGASPPNSNPYGGGLYLYAYQRADANIWKVLNSYNLAKAETWSRRIGSAQQFGARMSVLNNRISRSYIRDLTCATARNGNLLRRSYEIFRVSKTILMWGVVPLTFRASGYGYFVMDYQYSADVCNPFTPFARAGIIPYVKATASGSAYVTLAAVRGGATLAATLLKTSMPAFVTGSIASDRLKVCIDVDVTTSALSARFFIWADRLVKSGKWWQVWKGWKWKRWQEWTLASYSTGSNNYPILDNVCY